MHSFYITPLYKLIFQSHLNRILATLWKWNYNAYTTDLATYLQRNYREYLTEQDMILIRRPLNTSLSIITSAKNTVSPQAASALPYRTILSLTIVLLLILYILAAALSYIWLTKGYTFKLVNSSRMSAQSTYGRSYGCVRLIYIWALQTLLQVIQERISLVRSSRSM